MLSTILKIIVYVIAIIISIIVSIKWQGSLTSSGEIIGGALIFFFVIGGSFYLLVDFIKENKIKTYPRKIIKGIISFFGFLIASCVLIFMVYLLTSYHLYILIFVFIIFTY